MGTLLFKKFNYCDLHCNMENLENNLLAQVLRRVPRDDQLNLLLVSRRWYQVMDENVGIHAMLGRGTETVPVTTLFDTPDILKKLGVSICEFISFCNESHVPPKLKRPKLLHRISFQGYLSSATFESILDRNVISLHTLQLDHEALYHLEFSDIQVALAQCKVLEIVEATRMDQKASPITAARKAMIININAACLFTKSFPGLKHFKVTLTFIDAMDEVITSGLLTLIHNHTNTLTLVKIELPRDKYQNLRGQFKGEPPFQIPNSFRPITDFNSPNIDLKDLVLNFPQAVTKTVQNLNHWGTWLATLRTVESCFLIGDFNQSHFESTVNHCGSSCKRIRFDWTYRRIEIIGAQAEEDFQVSFNFSQLNGLLFKNCINLTHLKLIGNWHAFMVGEIPKALTNVASFPISLVHIGITSLPLECASCQTLCLEFPILKTLKLMNVSGRVGLGVQLAVVKEMMQRKQLRKFKVDLGFGDEPDIEGAVLNITSKIRHNNCFVKAYLHQNGQYTNEPEDGHDSDEELDVEHVNVFHSIAGD